MPTETTTPSYEQTDVTPVLGLNDDDFARLPEPSDMAPISAIPESSDDTGDNTGDVEYSADANTADAKDESSTQTPAQEIDTDSSLGSENQKAADADTKTPSAIDYEVEYKKLTQPFKANGGEIQVQNTDEIITLMQMGANYHKKMAALKPSMRMVKLLERHDLLDEGKLSFLIDLSKKDPAAIQRLVKESGIDPIDIDVDADVNYVPKVNPISDSEMLLDDVLEKIQDTESYGRTLQVVTRDWDNASRSVIATNPHIIEIINGQISNGIFDKVVTEVNRARSFGKLQGISDLEAYKQVGDIMHNQGLLQSQAPVATAPDASVQKKNDDEVKRNARRKAAGAPPVKKSVASVAPKSSVLAMSDDDFMKLPAAPYTKIN